MRTTNIFLVLLTCLSVSLASKPEAPAKKKLEKEEKPTKNIKHAAVGAKVTVTSTSKETEGEMGSKALVDGNLETRWSSAYSAPQRITIDLGKELSLQEIRLHWESAFATKYHILISDDGEGWKPAHFFFRVGSKTEPRVDKCKMKGVKARHIMFELNERVNSEWGFSLFEIEVIPAKAEKANP